MKKAVAGTFALAALLAAGCSQQSTTPTTTTPAAPAPVPATGTELNIAVIPKGSTHEYWSSVQAGADQAAKELNVNILWKGPLKEDDRAGQIQIVQTFVSDKVDGIVLAPLDENALVGPVKSAVAAHIPVVIIDSSLKADPGKDYTAFVATDNHKGGELGGQQLAKLLGGKGKVVMLRYEVGSASTEQREAGFLDAIAKFPGIKILNDSNYAGATQGEAQTKAMNMIDTLKQADGIFCPNESSTMGMLIALEQNRLIGKVKFVGFDTSPDLITALKAHQIDALVAQNPIKMGHDGVVTIVDAIQHKPYSPTQDTGVTLVTNDNVDQPDIKAILGV